MVLLEFLYFSRGEKLQNYYRCYRYNIAIYTPHMVLGVNTSGYVMVVAEHFVPARDN